MRRADSIVSRSRISPMSTTSGSSRRAARRALVKEWVSACSSRWFTTHFLCACRYSIGSSIVIMCSWRSVLILSSMAARVVDLPEPVGPVTSTSPRGLSQMVAITGGRPSSLKSADLVGDRAVDGRHRAALHEDVGAEAGQALDAEAEVQLQVLLEAMLLRVGEHAVGELLGLHRGQGRQVQRAQLAVHADLGRRVGGDVEVGAPHLRHRLQELMQADGHVAPPRVLRTVSRRTSSMVVMPALIFSRPLMRSVSMPSSRAFLLISTAVAPDHDQVADAFRDLHDLVEADAALVAGAVAHAAAASLVELEGAHHLRREADSMRVLAGTSCTSSLQLAQTAADEALGLDEVHRRAHQERLDAHVHQARDRARARRWCAGWRARGGR